MLLRYYIDQNGKRVYTLKVSHNYNILNTLTVFVPFALYHALMYLFQKVDPNGNPTYSAHPGKLILEFLCKYESNCLVEKYILINLMKFKLDIFLSAKTNRMLSIQQLYQTNELESILLLNLQAYMNQIRVHQL